MKKKKRNKKGTLIAIHNYLLIGLTISASFLIILVGLREYHLYKNNKDAKDVLTAFKSLKDVEGEYITYETSNLKLGGYKVIGSIKIDSIDIEYPILEKTNEDSLNLSVTKLHGPNLNEYGNVSIAGHNAHNGTLFSRLSSINIDDIVEITDAKNNTIKYRVYDIYSVMPDDLSPIKQDDKNIREITLISCIMSAKKRIIIKAIEI